MSLLDARLCMTEEKVAGIVEYLKMEQGRVGKLQTMPESTLIRSSLQQTPTNLSIAQTLAGNKTEPQVPSTRTNTYLNTTSSANEFETVKLSFQPQQQQYNQSSQHYTGASHDVEHVAENHQDHEFEQAGKDLSSQIDHEQYDSYDEYDEDEHHNQPIADTTDAATFIPSLTLPTAPTESAPTIQTSAVNSAQLALTAPPLPFLISTKYEPQLTETIATILSARGLSSSQTQQDPPMSARQYVSSSNSDGTGVIYQDTITGLKYQDNIGTGHGSMVDRINQDEINRGSHEYGDDSYDDIGAFQVEEEEVGEGVCVTKSQTVDWNMEQAGEFETEDGYYDDQGDTEFDVENDG